MMAGASNVPARLIRQRDQFLSWLCDRAYPLWASVGVDATSGAFVEAIGQDGSALAAPRRGRVTPRQVYAFANAGRLGWQGDVRGLTANGWRAYESYYRRPDGLYRTLVAADGTVLDGRALLYDQAFVLLAMASLQHIGAGRDDWQRRAADFIAVVDRHFAAPAGGYLSEPAAVTQRASNPHMHLLEACLLWATLQPAAEWNSRSDLIVRLALDRLLPADGVIREYFDADWQPAPGRDGQLYEPGHQFEWAWLLLRSARPGDHVRRAIALRLIDDVEQHGVRDNFVLNAMLADGTVADAGCRLWPQTERLKALLLAGSVTGNPRYWTNAVAALDALLRFLDTPIEGLWFDLRLPDGSIAEGPAPASTFYHLVCALEVLDATLGRRTASP